MNRQVTQFEDMELYRDWDRAINKGQPNDFVMVVTASSRTSVSGTGKSTLLARLGRDLDQTEEGFDAERKATLDAGKLAYDVVPGLPSKSAIIGDEMQGAPGTTGLDKRRGMKQEVVDAISSILANRDKQFTIIMGAQMIQMLDMRFVPIVDAWLLIRRGPDDPMGPIGTHHKVYIDDYNVRDPTIKTPAVEDFTWERLPHDDPDYSALEEMKQRAKTRRSEEEDEDSDLPKHVQKRIAQQFRDMGKSLRWISEHVDEITYKKDWIAKNTTKPTDTPKEKIA